MIFEKTWLAKLTICYKRSLLSVELFYSSTAMYMKQCYMGCLIAYTVSWLINITMNQSTISIQDMSISIYVYKYISAQKYIHHY